MNPYESNRGENTEPKIDMNRFYGVVCKLGVAAGTLWAGGNFVSAYQHDSRAVAAAEHGDAPRAAAELSARHDDIIDAIMSPGIIGAVGSLGGAISFRRKREES